MIAQRLRQADSLGPETRRDLATLMEELAETLPPSMSPALVQQLSETSEHLAEALHKRLEADVGLLSTVRQRWEETAGQVESRAPVLAGVLQRLVEALAGIGA